MVKVLNLYSGIGGNRKLWEDVEVTAVEMDEKIISIYEDNDFGTELFKVSIREQISSTPELLFTNDISRF